RTAGITTAGFLSEKCIRDPSVAAEMALWCSRQPFENPPRPAAVREPPQPQASPRSDSGISLIRSPIRRYSPSRPGGRPAELWSQSRAPSVGYGRGSRAGAPARPMLMPEYLHGSKQEETERGWTAAPNTLGRRQKLSYEVGQPS